jgi:hypothetical protein
MSIRKKGPELLLKHVDVLKSRMGSFFPGSHVIFRGHNLHTELKDMDWVELYLYGITGRRFTKQQSKLVQSMWTFTSYPDKRIWNNRVTALAGSSRSTGTLGMAASLAISEASIYGRGIDMRVFEFLLRTSQQINHGVDLGECIRQELLEHRSIAGYGRPLINGDERNQHILELAKDLGLDKGPYLRLAFNIEEYLLTNRYRMKMNYAGVVAALIADFGLSSKEYYLLSFPTFLAGMVPCFIEATDRTEGTLYPVPCTNVLYEGEFDRTWNKRKK